MLICLRKNLRLFPYELSNQIVDLFDEDHKYVLRSLVLSLHRLVSENVIYLPYKKGSVAFKMLSLSMPIPSSFTDISTFFVFVLF